jgi:hypothetical protein
MGIENGNFDANTMFFRALPHETTDAVAAARCDHGDVWRRL